MKACTIICDQCRCLMLDSDLLDFQVFTPIGHKINITIQADSPQADICWGCALNALQVELPQMLKRVKDG